MKRHWRPGWILLSILLAGLASLYFYAWPKQPLWSLSFDMAKNWFDLLGVDEDRRLVYVNYVDFENTNSELSRTRRSELRGYDLYSGRLVWRLSDTDVVFKDSPMSWNYWLSREQSQVVCYEHMSASLQIRSFPSCKLQYQIKFDEKESIDGLFSSYSSDGSQILVRTKSRVHLYDSSTGRQLDSLTIPELPEPALPPEDMVLSEKKDIKPQGPDEKGIKPVGTVIYASNTSNGNWAAMNHPLQLSCDKRFLAIVGSGTKSVLVFHVPEKKLLAQIPFSGIPRFLGNDNTLLLIPEFHLPDQPMNNQLKRYSVTENGVVEISQSGFFPTTIGETLCCDQRHMVTNEVQLNTPSSRPFWADWEWLSDELKFKMAMLLYAPRIRFDIYDLDLGKQERSFLLPLSNVFYASYLQRNWLSSDGKLLALNDGSSLAVWEVPSRLEFARWLVLLGIILCSLWLAWPRRVKPTPLAASPHAGK